MDQQQPLVCPSHATHYIAMVVLGMLIGAAGTFVYFSSTPGYQAGFDAAKKLVEQSSLAPMIKTPDDIRSLSGVVIKVEGKTVTMHTQSLNPFEDAALSDRIVAVTADTNIIILKQKSPTMLPGEITISAKSPQITAAAASPLVPPVPVVSTKGTISDIKVGDSITVTSAENIKDVKSFTAREVRIQ